MTRKCNCNKSNCINESCPCGGHCRKSIAVHRVKCKMTGKSHLGNTQKPHKRRIQQHNNETRKLFRNKESFDSCAQHFPKQFVHEPTPKQTQKITEHETMWKGNIVSVMKILALCIAPCA